MRRSRSPARASRRQPRASSPGKSMKTTTILCNSSIDSVRFAYQGGVDVMFGWWVWAHCIVGGMLGSSCCAIQLLIHVLTTLNVMNGVGCAGFNSYLGPIRLYVRSFSFVILLCAWIMTFLHGSSKQRLGVQSLVWIVLAFLPEMLIMAGGPVLAPPTDETEVVRLRIDGMGCEACQASVQWLLGTFPGVISSQANFKEGFGEVVVAKGWGGDRGRFNLTLVVDKMLDKGYIIYPAQEDRLLSEAAVRAEFAKEEPAVQEHSSA